MTSGACYHEGVRWALALLLVIGTAWAGPQVEIRAHTQLALTTVKVRDGGMLEVTGRLTDKLTGDGIPSERVYVTIDGRQEPAFTSVDGTFRIVTSGPAGPVEVSLAYKGGSRLEKADPLSVTMDPTKARITLALVKIVDDPAGARLKVNAIGDEGNVDVTVALDIAGVDDEKWKPVRSVKTNEEFTLTRKAAGGPGTKRLRATFQGDDTRQPAFALVTLELTSGTATTMALSEKALAFEDDLVVTGHVTDDDKLPVPRAAITLMSGDRRLAQGATDNKGRYRFEVEAELIADRQQPSASAASGSRPGAPSTAGCAKDAECSFGIQVKTDPDSPSMRPSQSDPQVIRISAPQPVPVSWTVVAFIATIGAAVAFFLARSKPWQKLRRTAAPADVPSEEGDIEQAHGGLVIAKPGVVATLRGPKDDGFSGVVRDTVRGRPIADSVVTITFGERQHMAPTAADGSFQFEKLDTGDWRAEVAAPGHVTERFSVTIPHRGELRGVRVDLVPVRERVFQLYRRAAEPVLPETRLWGVWSPRQIVDHVRAKRPSPALADLTDFVEEVYFSGRLAAETVLAEAGERVDRAIGERAVRR
jgi:hypothetical protein